MEFSNKYHEAQFPERYADKHKASISRRLNDRREQGLLNRCLQQAGNPESIADIGCGPGRFWPTLSAAADARLYGLDLSHAMLSFARQRYPESIAARFGLVSGSVTALPFADAAFDCVVSMRLLHHFGEPATRRQALTELSRVARHHVIVSLWTDGNYKAWRRARLEARRGRRSYQNRHIVSREELAADFAATDLTPIVHYDLLPGYSQWRYYLLRRTSGHPGQTR